MSNGKHPTHTEFETIIVGAGAAGIGVGVALRRMGFNFVILEKHSVGASFKKWPKEMQMISPSFTGNFFGMPDLNAITHGTSPAHTLLTEHPTGDEYAYYLEEVANLYEMPVIEGITVTKVRKEKNGFTIETDQQNFTSKFVIWAAGEFQYPNMNPFDGAGHCIHTSQVSTWSSFTDDSYLIVGAFESGMDAAYQLAKNGKKITVLDASKQLENNESDSSYSLSPFTRDRYKSQASNINIIQDKKVNKVQKDGEEYKVFTEDGEWFSTPTKPFLAIGFRSSLSLVDDLFEMKEGIIQLTENDESTIAKGLFLVGPQVRHEDAIFCFIYKFRQRFAIVAETIAKRNRKWKQARETIEEYKEFNFYLRDLTHCGDACPC